MKSYFSMKKIFISPIFVLFLTCLSCAAPREAASTGSQKMTPGGQQENETLRLGIKVRLPKAFEKSGPGIAQAFEDQMNVFMPCLAGISGTKAEVFLLKAKFAVSKQGVVTKAEVVSLEPEAPAISACFLKQIQQVDLGRQPQPVTGELTLGTYYGKFDARQ
jgi:hypothetical protein